MRANNSNQNDKIGGFMAMFSLLVSVFLKYFDQSKILYSILIIVTCVLVIIWAKNIFEHGMIFGFLLCIAFVSIMLQSEIRHFIKDTIDYSNEKKIYSSASTYKEQGQYDLSLKNFYKLSEKFINDHIDVQLQIEDTEALYKQKIFGNVDVLIGQGEYSEAIGLLNKTNTFFKEDDEIIAKIEEVRLKEIETKVESFVSQGHYVEAIHYLKEMLNEDYDEISLNEFLRQTQEQYIEATINQANTLIANNNYKEAKQLLDTADAQIDNNGRIIYKIAEVLIKLGQYDQAIQFLRNKIDKGNDNALIAEILNQAENQYIDLEIEKANKLIISKNYEKAKKVLLAAGEIVQNNDKINNKLTELSEKEPKLLSGFDKRKFSTNLGLDEIADYQDVFGYTYEGVSFAGDKQTLMDPFFYGNSFLINSKYKYLKGTITIFNKYKTGKISFYNDEDLIIEYSFDIAQDKPHEIKVDVSGVNLLSIQISGAAFANAKFYTE